METGVRAKTGTRANKGVRAKTHRRANIDARAKTGTRANIDLRAQNDALVGQTGIVCIQFRFNSRLRITLHPGDHYINTKSP